MASVDDVAAAIIEECDGVDPLKLQKLLYYAQGWSLVWHHRPIFDDADIEAWKWGPAVRHVYQEYRDNVDQRINTPKNGKADALTTDERETVRAIVKRYGKLSGTALMELTHDDPAWLAAWGSRSMSDRGSDVIPPEAIVRSLRRATFGHPRQRPDIEVAPDLIDAVTARQDGALGRLLEATLGAQTVNGDG